MNGRDSTSIEKLYTGVSSTLDIGTFDEFQGKMAVPESRQRFFDGVSQRLDIGTFDEFESKILPDLQPPKPQTPQDEYEQSLERTKVPELPKRGGAGAEYEPPGTLEQLGQAGATYLGGVSGAAKTNLQLLDNLANYVSEQTGWEKSGLFESLALPFEDAEEYWRGKGISEHHKGLLGFMRELYAGLGGASVDLPAIMGAGLPAYMTVRGAGEAAEEGTGMDIAKGAAVGATEGVLLHGIFKGLAPLARSIRVASGAALFGLPAIKAQLELPPEQRNWEQAIAETVIGGGLLVPGKGKMGIGDAVRQARDAYGGKFDVAVRTIEREVTANEKLIGEMKAGRERREALPEPAEMQDMFYEGKWYRWDTEQNTYVPKEGMETPKVTVEKPAEPTKEAKVAEKPPVSPPVPPEKPSKAITPEKGVQVPEKEKVTEKVTQEAKGKPAPEKVVEKEAKTEAEFTAEKAFKMADKEAYAKEMYGKSFKDLKIGELNKVIDNFSIKGEGDFPFDEVIYKKFPVRGLYRHMKTDIRSWMSSDKMGKYFTQGNFLIIDKAKSESARDKYWDTELRRLQNQGTPIEEAKKQIAKERKELADTEVKVREDIEKIISPKEDIASAEIVYKQFMDLKKANRRLIISTGKSQTAVDFDYFKTIEKEFPDATVRVTNANKSVADRRIIWVDGKGNLKAILMPRNDTVKGIPASYNPLEAPVTPKAGKAEKPPAPEQRHSLSISAFLPQPVQDKLTRLSNRMLNKPDNEVNAASWDIVRDHYSKKWGLEYKYSEKWQRELRDKFSDKELEDAMFYRQGTRNIFKDTDTPGGLEARMPDKLKFYVDKEVDEHISNMRKVYNESPWTKDINAREEVIKTYLTGVYSGNINKAYEFLVGLKGRQFVTNNFMRNKKTYLDFAEAFDKAGLVPRFRNLADQLNYQDNYMIRLLANNELIGKIKDLEKTSDFKLIVRSNSKLYDEAKSSGNYIPYDDPWLKAYVAGKKADDSPAWAVSKAPALVHKDLSDAIVSIFNRESYREPHKALQAYRNVGNILRYYKVSLSLFHFVPLAESLVGAQGFKAFNVPKLIYNAKRILNDPELMTETKEAGLKTRAPREASKRQIEGAIEKLTNVLEARGGLSKPVGKGVKMLFTPQRMLTNFLFNRYLPALKVLTYYHNKAGYAKYLDKKGLKATPKDQIEINRQIASVVNDQFGTQAWELLRTFNDPKVQQHLHDFVGYPDWTLSALRQAGASLEPGVRGYFGRRYWIRYIIGFIAAQQALNYLNTGFYNDEKGDVKWSWDKAHSTFENKDPLHAWDFQMPNIFIKILGRKYYPGKEIKEDGTPGRLYYSHFGKQMLEIGRYFKDPISQAFSKSNPMIQLIFTQLMGGRPYKGEIFPARGGYFEGQYKPWKGTKPWTRVRMKERLAEALAGLTPFSIQQMADKGIATLGALPMSKGLSTFAAGEYFEKALNVEDYDMVEDIKAVLRLNGYTEQTIERRYNTVLNRLIKEGVIK